jgi:hypothetical protein
LATRVSRQAPAAAPLDLEEGICDPRPPEACQRWPEGAFLVNETTGEAVLGCCKATNLCDCARHRFMRETTRMLALDAGEMPPTIFAVLTAREFLRKDDGMHDTFRQLLKALRRRWPVEWFARWEEQARGALHVNLLVKGVPVDEWQEFAAVLIERWCARVDAEPVGQYVEPIECGEAVVGYVSKKVSHTGKRNQEPSGWRNKHRTSQTRGYFVRPASVMRQEAKHSLRLDALVWRGRSVEVAEHELREREAENWRLVHRAPGSQAVRTAPAASDATDLRLPRAERRREAVDELQLRRDGGDRGATQERERGSPSYAGV